MARIFDHGNIKYRRRVDVSFVARRIKQAKMAALEPKLILLLVELQGHISLTL